MELFLNMKKRQLHEFGHQFSQLPRKTVIFERKCATVAFGAVGVKNDDSCLLAAQNRAGVREW